VFPIGDDDVRGAGLPWLSWGLIGANVLVFLYELTLGMEELQEFFMIYGVVPVTILRGEQLFSLFTSMFLHGGWAHILSNMVFLWVFGDNIEATLGKVGYFVFYIVGGLAASAMHILFNVNGEIPSLGASGAVAAILGAYVVMFPRSRVRVLLIFGFFARVTLVTALIFVGIWFVTQLFNGVASLGPATAQTGGVAYWAHVGGFVFGAIIGALFRHRAPELERDRRYRRRI